MWFQIISKCFFDSAFSYLGKNVLLQGMQYALKHDDYGDYVFISHVNSPKEAFYDNQDLLEYKEDSTLCFMAFVGVYNKEPLFKFGMSKPKDVGKFMVLFTTFRLVYIRQVNRHSKKAETFIIEEFKNKNIYRDIVVRDICVGDLFAVSPDYPFEKVRTTIDRIIEHVLIQDLNEIEHELQHLQEKMTGKEELIEEQRDTISFLKKIIENKD